MNNNGVIKAVTNDESSPAAMAATAGRGHWDEENFSSLVCSVQSYNFITFEK